MSSESSVSSATATFIRECDEYTKMLESGTHRVETYMDGGKLKLRSLPKSAGSPSAEGAIKSKEAVAEYVKQFLIEHAGDPKKSTAAAKAFNRLSNALTEYVQREFPKKSVLNELFASVTSKQHVEHVMMQRAAEKAPKKEVHADCVIRCIGKEGKPVEIPASSEFLMLSGLFEELIDSKDFDKKLDLSGTIKFNQRTVELALSWMQYNEIPPCTMEELTELRKLATYLNCRGLNNAVDSAISGFALNPLEQGEKRVALRKAVEETPQTTDCVIKCREGEGKEIAETRLAECHTLMLKRCDRIDRRLKAISRTAQEELIKSGAKEKRKVLPTKELNLEEFSKETVSLFLDWLYTDTLLSPCSPEQLVQLLVLAETVGCKSLIEHCRTELSQKFYNNPTLMCQLITDPRTPEAAMRILIEEFSIPRSPGPAIYKPFFPQLQKIFSEKADDPASVTALATLYLVCGESIPEDVMKHLHSVVDKEYAPAQFVMGSIHNKGLSGFAKSETEAEKFYKLASDQEYAPALWAYSLCLYKKVTSLRAKVRDRIGSVIENNRELSRLKPLSYQLAQKSSMQGYIPGEIVYIEMVRNGILSPDSVGDKERSEELYKRLAVEDHSQAQYMYGIRIVNKQYDQDVKLGLDLLHKAAEKGNFGAIAMLTRRYLDRKGEDLVLKEQVKRYMEMIGIDTPESVFESDIPLDRAFNSVRKLTDPFDYLLTPFDYYLYSFMFIIFLKFYYI